MCLGYNHGVSTKANMAGTLRHGETSEVDYMRSYFVRMKFVTEPRLHMIPSIDR